MIHEDPKKPDLISTQTTILIQKIYHPSHMVLRLMVTVPADWEVKEELEMLVALKSSQSHLIFMILTWTAWSLSFLLFQTLSISKTLSWFQYSTELSTFCKRRPVLPGRGNNDPQITQVDIPPHRAVLHLFVWSLSVSYIQFLWKKVLNHCTKLDLHLENWFEKRLEARLVVSTWCHKHAHHSDSSTWPECGLPQKTQDSKSTTGEDNGCLFRVIFFWSWQ